AEGDEAVVLTLSQDAAYDVGSANSATVTIHDNDSRPPTAPTADFTVNTTSGQAPLAVQFTDRSSGSITSRRWNFGDGSSHSSTAGPTHAEDEVVTYTQNAAETVGGANNTKILTIHNTSPPPPAPTADFTANTTSGQAPLAVRFTDRSSGSSITSRDWDFGDGSSHSSTPSPPPTNNKAGDYTVTLTATGSGGSNSRSLAIDSTAPPPPPPAGRSG